MFYSVLKNENMNSSSNEIQQNLEKNVKKGGMRPIIITSNYSYLVFGKGFSCKQRVFHACKHSWTPVSGENFNTKLKSSNLVNKRSGNNSVDKYAVSVNKDGLIARHLTLGKQFYILRR